MREWRALRCYRNAPYGRTGHPALPNFGVPYLCAYRFTRNDQIPRGDSREEGHDSGRHPRFASHKRKRSQIFGGPPLKAHTLRPRKTIFSTITDLRKMQVLPSNIPRNFKRAGTRVPNCGNRVRPWDNRVSLAR